MVNVALPTPVTTLVLQLAVAPAGNPLAASVTRLLINVGSPRLMEYTALEPGETACVTGDGNRVKRCYRFWRSVIFLSVKFMPWPVAIQ